MTVLSPKKDLTEQVEAGSTLFVKAIPSQTGTGP